MAPWAAPATLGHSLQGSTHQAGPQIPGLQAALPKEASPAPPLPLPKGAGALCPLGSYLVLGTSLHPVVLSQEAAQADGARAELRRGADAAPQ